MPRIVRVVVTRSPGPFFQLASITVCLVLWLWSGCSAAAGFSSVSSLELSDVPRPQFTLLQQAWSSDLLLLLSSSDVLDEAMLFGLPWAGRAGAVATGKMPPLLAAVPYAHNAALQFSLGQFLVPFAPLDLTTRLALPLELASERWGLRQFTVAQLYGTVSLHSPDHQALHYALYAGALTDEFPDRLLVGARIRYTFARGEVTVGIDSLYSPDAGGADDFAPFLTARTARLPSGESQIVAVLLRIEQDKRAVQDNHGPGLPVGDAAPLGVFIKPVLHLSPQWAVFYRFDHLSFGQGWPTWTEHVVGVRFFPTGAFVLRAEFLMNHLSQESIDTQGFRLAGTIRF